MPRKPSKKKVEIISFFDFQQHPHRQDFDTCPHCGKEFNHNEVWLKHRTAICTGIVQQKTDDGVVISECPSCFEKSWVHYGLRHTYQFTEAEQKASTKAWNDRHLSAIKELYGALCVSCSRIESLQVGTKTWRNCYAGCGRVVTECNSYKKHKGVRKIA